MLMFDGYAAQAQDSRPLALPKFKPVCATIEAPLRTNAEGPLAGNSAQQENQESRRETQLIQKALHDCEKGHAVQLTLGTTSAHTAFLIDPITIPSHVSLIIDGGVTVFASRSPYKYRVEGSGYRCGRVGHDYPVFGGCKPLVTLKSHSGVYGYGVLDGQAHRGLIRKGQFVSDTWWDLLLDKKNGCKNTEVKAKEGCEQASPPMIYSGLTAQGQLEKDLTLYKITIRNPPFHTVMLGGAGVTYGG